MQDLRISLVQSSLVWKDAEANCAAFSKKIAHLKGDTDVIVLPEMFNTGFAMDSWKLGETMDGPTISWMRKTAAELEAVITGSAVITENEKHYNRMVWMRPDGTYCTYDKRHLFRMAGEHNDFSAGEDRTIVALKGWRICLQVCYDLRFPVFSRNRTEDRYDLLLYVANWPEARNYPWSQLLIARAIENQCYVGAVNRVGTDGNDISFSGDSAMIDPYGQPMSSIVAGLEMIETVTISLEALEAFREKFPVGLDGDSFEL
jgi:omega-amidase